MTSLVRRDRTTRLLGGPAADGGGTPAPAPITFEEELVPTALNTLPDITHVPTAGTTIELWASGARQFEGFGFTRIAIALTWDAVTAGYDILPTDEVFVRYTY